MMGCLDEDSPKKWRRLFVKDAESWKVQFESPEGQRFDSPSEAKAFLFEKEGGILSSADLFLDSDTSSCASSEGPLLPITFCKMRQNIFDLKKKRRKKSTSRLKLTGKVEPLFNPAVCAPDEGYSSTEGSFSPHDEAEVEVSTTFDMPFVATVSESPHVLIPDIFKNTPLSGILCGGCRRSFTSSDSLTVNFSTGRILIHCAGCLWSTYRSFFSENFTYS